MFDWFHFLTKAVENDVAVDHAFGRSMGIENIYIARPQKTEWINLFFNKYPYLFFIFLPFLFALVMVFNVSRFVVSIIHVCSSWQERKAISVKKFDFNFLGRDVLIGKHTIRSSDFFNFKKVSRHNGFLILVWLVLQSSFFAFYLLVKPRSLSHAYFLFDLLCYRNFFRSAQYVGPIRSVHHYDRWATLADDVFMDYSIFQHGLVYEIKLPWLYLNARKIYVYDQNQADLFSAFFSSSPSIFKLGFSFSLIPDKLPTTCNNLLLVGQPLFSARISSFYGWLIESNRWNIYYRPHPKVMDESMRGVPVVTKNFRFDIVVSHSSTLGSEYESVGVPVVWVSKILDRSDFFAALDSALDKS